MVVLRIEILRRLRRAAHLHSSLNCFVPWCGESECWSRAASSPSSGCGMRGGCLSRRDDKTGLVWGFLLFTPRASTDNLFDKYISSKSQ